MKKINMLIPILGAGSLVVMALPTTSCDNSSFVVTLYTEVGTFGNGSNVIRIQTTQQKELNLIEGYSEPSLISYEFNGWVDDEGKAFAPNSIINRNTILIAQFKEGPIAEPKNFTADSWPTLVDTCSKGYLTFAKAYCGYDGSDETEAIEAINNFTYGDTNIRYMYLGFEDEAVVAPVKIIGANCESFNDNAEHINFTFEFNEVIDLVPFNPPENTNQWRESFLRWYLNGDEDGGGLILDAIPESVYKGMLLVNKGTKVTSYQGKDEGVTFTDDYLFPLSRYEMNDINAKADDGDVDESEDNFIYPYYAHFQQTTEWDKMGERIKNYIGTNSPINYWTRSPYLGDYNGVPEEKQQWEEMNGRYVNGGVVYDGGIHPHYMSTASIGIAPAFVLGGEVE